MVNWWLDKGLAGFRIDAIVNIKKPLPFCDYPADREDGLCDMGQVLAHAQGIGAFLGELKDKAFAPHDALTIGEVFNVPDEQLGGFIGENGYFSSMFDFRETVFGHSPLGWYDCKLPTPDNYKRCCFESQKKSAGTGYLSNIIENHDEPRGVSHYLPGMHRPKPEKSFWLPCILCCVGCPLSTAEMGRPLWLSETSGRMNL